jgi:hypothetical protein
MLRAMWKPLVVVALAWPSLALAQNAPESRERAVVVIAGAEGARVIADADADALVSRAETLLARCRAEGRAAGLADDVLVRLSIDARGGMIAATVAGEGDADDIVRRWHGCVTRQLLQLRSAAGGAGTVELRVHWNDPSEPGEPIGNPIGESFGFGGLGLRGSGAGRAGVGEGTIGLGTVGARGRPTGGAAGRSGPSARVPRVRTGNADVEGGLSREVIRRVVRRHIDELRFCYEQALDRDPELAGRVSVQFTIDREGSVREAAIASDTMGDGATSACIAHVVQRWAFPAPAGGEVRVSYPFVFDSLGRAEP